MGCSSWWSGGWHWARRLIRPHHTGFVARVLFPSAVIGLAGPFAGWSALHPGTLPQTLVLPLGLPDLPFHLRLDALSGFFVLLIGVTAAGISSRRRLLPRGAGDRAGSALPPVPRVSRQHGAGGPGRRRLPVHGGLGDHGPELVFLVTTQHRIPEIRRAGFLYLLIAHIGAISICSASACSRRQLAFTFDAMRGPALTRRRPASLSSRRCSVSGRRPDWCRCMSGCPRHIPRRPRPFRQ